MTSSDSLPDDATGDALRRVLDDGSDLSQPMVIDYHISVPDATSGRQIAERAASLGFDAEVVLDSETGEFTVWCTRRMIATYDAITEDERRLDEIAQPYGGYLDGWGTFGNAESD